MMQQEPSATVRWGEWIGEGWQMFAEQWKVWVLQILIVFLVFAVPIVPFYLMMIAMQLNTPPGEVPEFPVLFFPLLFAIFLISILGSAYFWSGLYKTAFKQMRGEQISVGDLFSGGDVFLRVLGGLLAVSLLAFLGIFLCILPYFVVLGLLHFTVPLIVERNLGVGEALSTSYKATKANWFMTTIFVLVLYMLASLGAVACYVGALASYPLLFTITAIAYRDVFGVAGARRFSANQQQYPTNYTGPSWASSGPVPPPPPQYGESPDQQATLTICPNCGTQMSRGARFCNKCGSQINAG
jgi:hypothetical protein